jgi:hypothetical protein
MKCYIGGERGADNSNYAVNLQSRRADEPAARSLQRRVRAGVEEMERLLVRVETDEWIYEEFEFL